MSCPYFKEGYFGICVAPDAVHVPNIRELERYCFRPWFRRCPSLAGSGESMDEETMLRTAANAASAAGEATSV